MRRAAKFLGRIGIGALIIAIVLGGSGMFYFKSYLPKTVAPRSFPQIDGEVKLEGLDGVVDIYRDNMGIPHIYATSLHDLYFAQGYVHTQERFWQMDAWRHIGSGRLSEMFGEGQVETDTFLRTLGWRVTAEKEWESMRPGSKAILQSYTDGINAYLNDHQGNAVSLEYAVLGLLSPDYKIQPWEPVNSMTWGKAMAWDLRGNMDEEIERAVLLKNFTPEQVRQLFPAYPKDHPVIVNSIGEGTSATPTESYSSALDIPNETLAAIKYNASLLDPMLGPLSDGIGSNSWAVSGILTETGMPLLANDPHLGIQMPSIWYQMDMHCMPKSDKCPLEVAGFSFAGVPGIIIGHNADIAWGFTNVGPDVMDLFIEKVNPENPDQYEVNGQWVDFETRQETIDVVGSEPVTVTVRLTRHGPVISDSYGPLKDKGDPKEFEAFKDRSGVELPENYVITLAWTALTPSTPFEAIWGFNKAQNWDEFREAARNFHVPAQNLLYADTQGNIGYQMPGDIPIRGKGDGTIPVPGWTGEYDWTGYIPFDELPYTFNPAEGYIVTANNQVPPQGYPYLITHDWDYGFRANRIVQMIKETPGKINIAYIQKMQGDTFDANASVFVPLLTGMDYKAPTQNQAIAMDLLGQWDYQATADSSAAAVFMAFTRALERNTFNDDLPERYWPDGGSRWNEVLRTIAQDPNSFWWDDHSTADKAERRDDILKKSFADGVAELEKNYGKDPSKWTWGEMHAATFRNGTLGESGIGPIESLFNRGPFPVGGGEAIVNATGWSVRDGYETNWLPSMRMIVDLSNLNNSVTVHTTGESGHAYHPHYDDMSKMWASIQYYPMWWDQNSVIEDAEGHLKLMP